MAAEGVLQRLTRAGEGKPGREAIRSTARRPGGLGRSIVSVCLS